MFSSWFKKKSVVTVNGVEYEGTNITISDGQVKIDGKVKNQSIGHTVNVEIKGDCEKVKNASGDIILGKHSEVRGILEEGDVEEFDITGEVADVLLEIFPSGTISGYNPLEYLACPECHQDLNVGEICPCQEETE